LDFSKALIKEVRDKTWNQNTSKDFLDEQLSSRRTIFQDPLAQKLAQLLVDSNPSAQGRKDMVSVETKIKDGQGELFFTEANSGQDERVNTPQGMGKVGNLAGLGELYDIDYAIRDAAQRVSVRQGSRGLNLPVSRTELPLRIQEEHIPSLWGGQSYESRGLGTIARINQSGSRTWYRPNAGYSGKSHRQNQEAKASIAMRPESLSFLSEPEAQVKIQQSFSALEDKGSSTLEQAQTAREILQYYRQGHDPSASAGIQNSPAASLQYQGQSDPGLGSQTEFSVIPTALGEISPVEQQGRTQLDPVLSDTVRSLKEPRVQEILNQAMKGLKPTNSPGQSSGSSPKSGPAQQNTSNRLAQKVARSSMMDRINANYQRDRARLEEEEGKKDPMMTSVDSPSAGPGTGDSQDGAFQSIDLAVEDLINKIKAELRDEL
jgi:hypothetical protein